MTKKTILCAAVVAGGLFALIGCGEPSKPGTGSGTGKPTTKDPAKEVIDKAADKAKEGVDKTRDAAKDAEAKAKEWGGKVEEFTKDIGKQLEPVGKKVEELKTAANDAKLDAVKKAEASKLYQDAEGALNKIKEMFNADALKKITTPEGLEELKKKIGEAIKEFVAKFK